MIEFVGGFDLFIVLVDFFVSLIYWLFGLLMLSLQDIFKMMVIVNCLMVIIQFFGLLSMFLQYISVFCSWQF